MSRAQRRGRCRFRRLHRAVPARDSRRARATRAGDRERRRRGGEGAAGCGGAWACGGAAAQPRPRPAPSWYRPWTSSTCLASARAAWDRQSRRARGGAAATAGGRGGRASECAGHEFAASRILFSVVGRTFGLYGPKLSFFGLVLHPIGPRSHRPPSSSPPGASAAAATSPSRAGLEVATDGAVCSPSRRWSRG